MNINQTKYLLFTLLLFLLLPLHGQYSLEMAIQDAKANSSFSKINSLNQEIGTKRIDNISTSFYPKLGVTGQATYQSAVTELPIELPGIEIEGLSKDQYRLQAEIRQVIFDGGSIQKMKDIVSLSTSIEELKNEADFEKTSLAVITTYFMILELRAQSDLLGLKRENLEANQSVIEAGIKNGVLLSSDLHEIQAALIGVSQELNKLEAYRRRAIESLSLFTGAEIDQNSEFSEPISIDNSSQDYGEKAIMRQLDLQKELLIKNQELSESKSLPTANVFFNGGYGRPALNFLNNSFEPYFLGGVQVSWKLNNLYTKSKEKQILQLNHLLIDERKNTIEDGLDQQKLGYQNEINLLNELIKSDQEILELRSKIRISAEAQLKNGTLTSSNLIPYINEENEVQVRMALRKLQIIKNQYLLEHLVGNLNN